MPNTSLTLVLHTGWHGSGRVLSRPGSPALTRSTLGSQDAGDNPPPSLVVFSGGTAFNSIAGAQSHLRPTVAAQLHAASYACQTMQALCAS